MKKSKFLTLIVSFVLVSVFTFVGVASAQSVRTGENVGVAQGQTVDSFLFIAGNNIDIAGTVNGDLYCAGQTINISGTVKGDVFCAGQTINISGDIDGSVRLASQTVNIGGKIADNATIGSQNITIDSKASIGRDLLGGASNISVNGTIGRDVSLGGETLNIAGSIGRDVNGYIDNISLGQTGTVKGSVVYTGKHDLIKSEGGSVSGAITRSEPKSQNIDLRPEVIASIIIASLAFVFISALIFALAIALMFPKQLEDSISKVVKAPLKTVFTGLIAGIVVPILLITVFATIVGIPLASFLLLVWLLVLTVSGPVSAYLLGKLIMRKSKSPVLIMLVGSSILLTAMLIPFVGLIAFWASGLFGIGAVLLQARGLFARNTTK